VAHDGWAGAGREGAVPVAEHQGDPEGGVTRRWRRPTSRTSLRVPRTAGMISASQTSRRMTSGGRSRPSALVPTRVATPEASRSSLRVSWSRVTSSRAGTAWESGTPVGVQPVLGEREARKPYRSRLRGSRQTRPTRRRVSTGSTNETEGLDKLHQRCGGSRQARPTQRGGLDRLDQRRGLDRLDQRRGG
jgi:hypothetical protein